MLKAKDIENVEVLKSLIKTCDLQEQRLKIAVNHIQHKFPLTNNELSNLTNEELAFLDLLTTRFTKLQNLIDHKVFPQLLYLLKEDISTTSFIDRLNKLEKLTILPNVAFWDELGEIRNDLAHEYPENQDELVATLNKCTNHIGLLLAYWQELKNYILKVLPQ